MAGLSTNAVLPTNLKIMMGAFSSAAKDIRSEINQILKEAKNAAKEGKELSNEKRGMLDGLYEKQERIKDQKKQFAKYQKDIKKDFNKAGSSLQSAAMVGSGVVSGLSDNIIGASYDALKMYVVPRFLESVMTGGINKYAGQASNVLRRLSSELKPTQSSLINKTGVYEFTDNQLNSRAFKFSEYIRNKRNPYLAGMAGRVYSRGMGVMNAASYTLGKVADIGTELYSRKLVYGGYAAVGYAAYRGIDWYIKERTASFKRDANSRAEIAALTSSILNPDAYGSKYSGDFGLQLNTSVNNAGAYINTSVAKIKLTERIRSILNLGKSAAVDKAETDAQKQAIKMSIMEKRHKNLSKVLDIDNIINSAAGQTELNRIKYGMSNPEGFWGSIKGAIRGVRWAGNQFVGASLEHEERADLVMWAVKQQGKQIDTVESITDRIRSMNATNPKLREQNKNRAFIFDSANRQIYMSGMQWNPY